MSPARARSLVIVLVVLAIAGVLVANAHFLLMAETSQPACVAHVKGGDRVAQPGAFSAARSSC